MTPHTPIYYTKQPPLPVSIRISPTEIFCHSLQTGQEIRILNTWIPNFNVFYAKNIQGNAARCRVGPLLAARNSVMARSMTVTSVPSVTLSSTFGEDTFTNLTRNRNAREESHLHLRVRRNRELLNVDLRCVPRSFPHLTVGAVFERRHGVSYACNPFIEAVAGAERLFKRIDETPEHVAAPAHSAPIAGNMIARGIPGERCKG
jgi:hypothetical protein